jgi:hypothetical protein
MKTKILSILFLLTVILFISSTDLYGSDSDWFWDTESPNRKPSLIYFDFGVGASIPEYFQNTTQLGVAVTKDRTKYLAFQLRGSVYDEGRGQCCHKTSYGNPTSFFATINFIGYIKDNVQVSGGFGFGESSRKFSYRDGTVYVFSAGYDVYPTSIAGMILGADLVVGTFASLGVFVKFRIR